MRKFRSLITFCALVLGLFVGAANAQNFVAAGAPSEQQVYKKLVNLSRYGVFDFISFDMRGDTVVLNGRAHTLGLKSDAASAVKKLPGVRHVVNNIEQLSPSSFDDRLRGSLLRSFARGGLSQYLWPTRPDVHIIVEGGRVTLEGYVSNTADRDRFNIYANGTSGVFSVDNNLVVGKRPV